MLTNKHLEEIKEIADKKLKAKGITVAFLSTEIVKAIIAAYHENRYKIVGT